MSVSIERFAAELTPGTTVLFLGAGASIESGAPTGDELARHLWKELAEADPPSTDLIEITSILENRRGRVAMVQAMRRRFAKLEPAGGLLLLPLLQWKCLYTTNFDRLIEKAYSRAGVPLTVVRSNYEYQVAERPNETCLYKIHGCINQDEDKGSRARMTLTERDYEEHAAYREALFKKLDADLFGGSIVFVGYSLRDPHLRERILEAGRAKIDSGAPGRILALLFEKNEDRANLIERKGVQVAFGKLDDLLSHLLERGETSVTAKVESSSGLSVPRGIHLSAIEVGHAKGLDPDASRLFNGSAASYADIDAGYTFPWDAEERFAKEFLASDKFSWIVTGVAGVGKTTFARRLVASAFDQGILCWEHKDETAFVASDWIAIEASLRTAGKRGILFIDECLQFIRQVGLLAESLSNNSNSALQLVLTANHSQWYRRAKSPLLIKYGTLVQLSKLSTDEMNRLLRLLQDQSAIRELVDNQFARLAPVERRAHLRLRCSADMYVCLKNIFAFEHLDTILLREYGELPEDLRDIYRHVAALQAAGTRVHRQLIIRTLDIQAGAIAGILDELDGLVDEYDIKPSEGIYGWSTRHIVIATTIAQYKFSDQTELYALLCRVVDGLNPAVPLELRTLRDLCNSDFGVKSLVDLEQQLHIYRKLIALAPGERVPYHRWISTLSRHGRLDLTDQAIRSAEAAVGLDSVINRYKVIHAIQRAERTEGILTEDRLAMLRNAETVALNGIRTFSTDKYSYTTYGLVGLAIAELSGDMTVLDDAIECLRQAADELYDDLLLERLKVLEERRRQLPRKAIRPNRLL